MTDGQLLTDKDTSWGGSIGKRREERDIGTRKKIRERLESAEQKEKEADERGK